MKSRIMQCRRDLPAGITLIELLVVVFITLLITAIAIPVMIPSVQERRLRETSRVITSHFQGARTRAIQTGRSFGVLIEPQPSMIGAGITLSYVADAEPWSGDTMTTRAFVRGNLPSAGNPYGLLDYFIDGGTITPQSWQFIIRPGDTIQFGYAGQKYIVSSGEPFTDANSDGSWNTGEPYVDLDGDSTYKPPQLDVNGFINGLPWTLTATGGSAPIVPSVSPAYFDNNSNGAPDPGEWNGFQFQVFRQPVKTAAHPLQLPNAMAIDLQYSETSMVTPLLGKGPVMVLFSSTGAVESMQYYKNGKKFYSPLVSPLFLLVGRQEKIGLPPPNTNYEDPTNFWVTIHPQTGLITSTEVTDADGNGTITLAESRFLAERGMALGGR